MHFLARGIYFLPLLLTLGLGPAQAQSIPTFGSTDPPPIVVDVRFSGNRVFADDVLALQVRTRANRRFLNVPGFTWWLWLYRLGESGTLGKKVGRALMASGEAPAFLDSTVISADVERLRLFYRQEGFRDAEVDAHIDTLGHGNRVRVAFEIHRGAPTYIGEVRYEGIDSLDAARRQQLVRGSLLRPPRSATGDDLRFQPRNQRYSEPTLLEERRRLLTFLRDQGYAMVSRDSIRAIVFPEDADTFDVAFRINPGPRYRFGAVHFRVEGPEPGARTRADTFHVDQEVIPDSGAVITTRIEDEKKLDPLLLVRSLRFQPGDVYDQSRVLATKRRLEGTGVFSFSDISPLTPDSTGNDSTAVPVLTHVIDLTTRQRHNIRFETFALQRSGVFGGSESELGMGLGVTYQNANLFGQGEAFQVGVNGSVAANVDPSARTPSSAGGHLFSSAQAEVSTSLTYPYLIAPFRGLDDLFDLYDARTQVSLSLLTARRDQFHLVIRGKGSARMRLQLQHSRTKTSFLDVLDLTLSNPDTLSGFRQDFLNKILGVDTTASGDTIYVVRDPVQRMQLIQDYTQPQINSALRYTIRATNVNPLQHERGYSFENSFELGGNLLYLLDRFVFSPGTAEGNLPGLPFFREGRRDNRLTYKQYFRYVTDLRRYYPVARGRVLAWRLTGGFAQTFADSSLIPFDRRFYAGGGTSVRGWPLRSLGPGPTGNYFGGDIQLEGSAELRARLLGNVFGADWSGALFTDAGNVWLGPHSTGDPAAHFKFDRFYKQIAVGSGVGLRIAWEYLVLRFDLAWKVYDPTYHVVIDPVTHTVVLDPVTGEPEQEAGGFLPDGPGKPVLHFGIGHAF